MKQLNKIRMCLCLNVFLLIFIGTCITTFASNSKYFRFGPNEDLDRYPKDLDGDLQKCNSQHVDIVFTPSEMYESNHNWEIWVRKNNIC